MLRAAERQRIHTHAPRAVEFAATGVIAGTLQFEQSGSQMAEGIALTFPVSNLAAGSYTLEVRVTHDNGQDAVVRSADFEVK